jgi:hypothetical protein
MKTEMLDRPKTLGSEAQYLAVGVHVWCIVVSLFAVLLLQISLT